MNLNKKKRNIICLDIFFTLILIVIDQFSKMLAVKHLKAQPPIVIMEGIFELRYLENRGAAFGMLQNQKWFFIIITCIVLLGICYIIFKVPVKKKYNSIHILLVLIASGAIGNMLDRIRLEYVVDFFYFSLINFPIFNVADIYVTVSCFLMAILLLFVYKDEDLDFLNLRKSDN